MADLKLTVGVDTTYSNANAVTYAPQDYTVEIMFNPNQLSRPPLDVARTMIHELIHAEMYRKLLSLSQQGSIPWSEGFIHSIRNHYPGLHDYYMRYYYNRPEGIPLGDPQHELMAQHYRDIIKQVLREFDNSQTEEIYDALSWVGLTGGGPINPDTGLGPNPTTAWEKLQSQERLNIISTRNTFLNSNTNCQE